MQYAINIFKNVSSYFYLSSHLEINYRWHYLCVCVSSLTTFDKFQWFIVWNEYLFGPVVVRIDENVGIRDVVGREVDGDDRPAV